ncbi:hypothetical protein [Rubrivirga sp. IMCC45206]|uniref:hypothetical protein n=1 Tax=Rubrivirga sp. IMCC45206 TaxID=3391614 RepID=UPI00398FCB37
MRLALLALALVLAACDTTVDRAVPPAGDFPAVSLAALVTAAPGRYNVAGVVQSVEACDVSRLALCAAAGVLAVGDALAPETDPGPPVVMALVDVPEAWARGDRGTFSVETLAPPGSPHTVVRVIGYSR